MSALTEAVGGSAMATPGNTRPALKRVQFMEMHRKLCKLRGMSYFLDNLCGDMEANGDTVGLALGRQVISNVEGFMDHVREKAEL